MRNTIKILTAIFLFSGLQLQAQIETANNLYKKYGFKVSIPKYEKMEDLSLEELEKVADSYRLNHDPENAEIWYSQVVEQSNNPMNILHYAQALQSNGKLEQAKEQYLRYDELIGEGADDRRGELLAQSIDRIREFKVDGVEIKNEEILNTENLDFSPSYCKDGLVFVSTRGVPEDAGRKDIWMDDNFTSLWCSTREDDGELSEPEQLSHNLTSKFHDGPVSFSKNGKTIFYSSNHYDGKRRNTKKGVMKQQIYRARQNGNEWTEPEELNFNDQQWEEVHPSLSPDGRKLYFASDRPGGYGGMDLYVVNKIGKGWSEPHNLGSDINSKGNEVFPFVHDNGTLYFASNGWEGLGGLDIYETQMIDDSTWIKPQNMGDPYNSPMDDFGFILDPTGTEGYLTSARAGGFGQDDIYSFRRGNLKKKKQLIPVQICTYENGTNNRIADADVIVREVNENGEIMELDEDFVMRLVETENKDEYILKLKKDLNAFEDETVPTYSTNEEGVFMMDAKPGVRYLFEAKKNGYTVGSAETTFEKAGFEAQEFCIPLESQNCLSLVGNTINEKYKTKMIPGTKVTFVNLCTGEEQSVLSDKDGFYRFPCLECECDFVLKGEKTNFAPGTAQATTIGEDCTQAGTIVADIYLTPGDPNEIFFANFNDPGKPGNPAIPGEFELEVGQIIELKNIYYDFDQYYIREDATDDLENVIRLMKAYPSLIIELSSHTDARASHSYNETLSQNRAEAAVEYIVKNGISPHRLKAKGYGETKLRNKCKNGVECTEAQHQNNRRTEIKILEHHEKNFNIEYINNAPETIDPADPNRRWGW